MKFLSQLLKEFAMQSTSDYVFDTPSGEAGSLKIPITGPMFKRIWPTIRSTVFHATDLSGLEKLKRSNFQPPKGPCGHDNWTKGLQK